MKVSDVSLACGCASQNRMPQEARCLLLVETKQDVSPEAPCKQAHLFVTPIPDVVQEAHKGLVFLAKHLQQNRERCPSVFAGRHRGHGTQARAALTRSGQRGLHQAAVTSNTDCSLTSFF